MLANTCSFQIMQLMEWTFLAAVCAVHPHVVQGASPSPRFHNQSNVTTVVAKGNVSIPVVAHQSQKAYPSSGSSVDDYLEYYYDAGGTAHLSADRVQNKQTGFNKRATRQQPPDPGEVIMEDEPVKVQGCRAPLCVGTVDTIVLVDVSGSVGEHGVNMVKKMLQKFPYHFHGPRDGSGGQFLALMSYGKHHKIHTQWTEDPEVFKQAANGLELHWGSGDLGAGLSMSSQLLRYARAESYHNVLVITDGGSYSQQKALKGAEMVGQSGGVIYMVVVENFNGPGPAYDESFQVVQAAGQYPAEDYMLSVNRYDDLVKDDFIGQMVYSLCPQVMTLLSTGSKVVRTIVDGNRTATTHRKKPQRKLRKPQIGSKHA